ncbi:unnamed protein product [Moneuplotes crassus]|uniref:Uncharacterized protein n=1 Tax=Euplotes crassus TaxID=5936 RepID=A0AAD1UA58_EUPCR|nr:unnamed protein product [Moneuplotes crassus]
MFLHKKSNIELKNQKIQKYLKHVYKNHKISQINVEGKISKAIKSNKCSIVGDKASVSTRLEPPQESSLQRMNSNPDRIVLLSHIKDIEKKRGFKPVRLVHHDRTQTKMSHRRIPLPGKAKTKSGIGTLNNSSQNSLSESINEYRMGCTFLGKKKPSSLKYRNSKCNTKSKKQTMRSLLARKILKLQKSRPMSFYEKRMAMIKKAESSILKGSNTPFKESSNPFNSQSLIQRYTYANFLTKDNNDYQEKLRIDGIGHPNIINMSPKKLDTSGKPIYKNCSDKKQTRSSASLMICLKKIENRTNTSCSKNASKMLNQLNPHEEHNNDNKESSQKVPSKKGVKQKLCVPSSTNSMRSSRPKSQFLTRLREKKKNKLNTDLLFLSQN